MSKGLTNIRLERLYEMKRLLGLLLLSAAASFWLLAAAPSSADDNDTVTVVTAPPAAKAQVCYDVDHGEDVRVDVVLETKTYGLDKAQVRTLVMLCELSTINTFPIPDYTFVTVAPSPPPVADTSIFACYALRGGDNAGMGAHLKTVSFGKDTVTVGTSNIMCESAKKHVTNRDGSVSTYGVSTNNILQCFKLANGDNPNLAVSFANNNFGSDVVTTGKGIGLCEEGVKYRDINGQTEITGMANGVAYECFDVADWADDEQKAVVLETENFGRDKVIVRKATQICQLADKADFHIVTAYPWQP